MAEYSGIYQHYEGNIAQCNAVQQTREIVFVTTSGSLRYLDCSGNYWYLGKEGPAGVSGIAGASGVPGTSGIAGSTGLADGESGYIPIWESSSGLGLSALFQDDNVIYSSGRNINLAGTNQLLFGNDDNQSVIQNQGSLLYVYSPSGYVSTASGELGLYSYENILLWSASGINFNFDDTNNARLDSTGLYNQVITQASAASGVIVDESGYYKYYTYDQLWEAISSVAASGTENYIPKYTSSGTLAESTMYNNGTNVGFGIINPTSMLHIYGASPTIQLTDSTTAANSYLDADSSVGALILSADADNTVANTNITMQIDGTNRFRIEADGKFGNTTNIASTAHIEATTPTIRLSDSDAATTQAALGWIDFYQGNATAQIGRIGYTSTGDSNLEIRNSIAGNLEFWTNNLQRMTITSAGLVGIGETNPQSMLEVTTTARTDTFSASDSSTWADVIVSNPTDTLNAATGIKFYVDENFATSAGAGIACIKVDATANQYDLAFMVDSTGATYEAMRIVSTGLVGIGTNDPTSNLDIQSTGTVWLKLLSDTDDDGANDCRITMGTGGIAGDWSFGIDESNSKAFVFAYNGSTLSTEQRVVITSGGNVGIGTASPDRLFHAEVEDAATNTTTYLMRLSHATTGTGAEGLGAGIEFEVEDQYGNMDIVSTIEGISDSGSNGYLEIHVLAGGTLEHTATFYSHYLKLEQHGVGDSTGIVIDSQDLGDSYIEWHNNGSKVQKMFWDNSDGRFEVESAIRFTAAVTLATIANDDDTYTGILTSDSGEIKYRTLAQLLSDLGGTGTGVIGGAGTDTYIPAWNGTSDLENSPMFVESNTNITIGDTAGVAAHLTIYDFSIGPTTTYYGIFNRHRKTAGSSNYNDTMYGIYNDFEIEDLGQTHASLNGIRTRALLDAGNIGDATHTLDLYGIHNTAQITASVITDSNVFGDVYGLWNSVNLDVANVTGNIYGVYSYMDVDNSTIGGDAYGIYIDFASFSSVAGTTYGLYIPDTNMDYAIYVNDQCYFGGNVGIGATTIDQMLHLEGASVSIQLEDTDANGYSLISTTGTSDLQFKADDSDVDANSKITFDVDGTERMRIDSSGNVGIGTTNTTNFRLNSQISAGSSYAFHAQDPSGGSIGGLYIDGTGNGEFFLKDNTNTTTIKLDSNGDSYFNGGNVGIGTTPGLRLHVSDTISQVARFENTGGVTVWTEYQNNTADYFIGYGAAGFLFSPDTSTIDMTIDSAGDVTVNGGDLFVDGGNVGIGTDSLSSTHLRIYDTTLNTTASYYGIYNLHYKYSGTTDLDDSMFGMYNRFDMIDADSTVGRVRGLYNYARILDGTIGTGRHLYGIQNTAGIDGGTIGGDMRGIDTTVNGDAGSVGGDIYGIYSNVDLEGTMTGIGGSVYGMYMTMDVDENPTGLVYMLYLEENSTIDYCIYQDGTANNYFGGKIGIGKVPSVALDIQAASARVYCTSSTGTNNSFYRAINGTSSSWFGVENSAGGTISIGSSPYATVINSSGAYPVQIGTNDNIRLTIDSSGKVGMGTDDPDARLHVSQGTPTGTTPSAEADMFLLETNGAPQGMSIITGDTHRANIMFGNTSDSTAALIRWDNANNLMTVGTFGSDALSLMTASTLRMTIDSSGNVGITTGDLKVSTDSKKLYLGASDDAYVEFDGNSLNLVANTVTAGDDMNFTADLFLFHSVADNASILRVYGADATTEYAGLGTETGYAIFSGGGVGTTSTGLKLVAANGGTEFDAVTIDSSGNVDITTGSLTIGSIDHDNATYTGVLTSDSGVIKYRTGAELLSDIGAISGNGNAYAIPRFNGTTTLTDSIMTQPAGYDHIDITGANSQRLKLNSSSSTGSPYVSFAQGGTRRSFIQHQDSGDNLKITSEYGSITLEPGAGGTESVALTIDQDSATFSGDINLDDGQSIVFVQESPIYEFIGSDSGVLSIGYTDSLEFKQGGGGGSSTIALFDSDGDFTCYGSMILGDSGALANSSLTFDGYGGTGTLTHNNASACLEIGGDFDSVQIPTGTSNPSSGSGAGTMYFNTSSNILYIYNGSAWKYIPTTAV